MSPPLETLGQYTEAIALLQSAVGGTAYVTPDFDSSKTVNLLNLEYLGPAQQDKLFALTKNVVHKTTTIVANRDVNLIDPRKNQRLLENSRWVVMANAFPTPRPSYEALGQVSTLYGDHKIKFRPSYVLLYDHHGGWFLDTFTFQGHGLKNQQSEVRDTLIALKEAETWPSNSPLPLNAILAYGREVPKNACISLVPR